MYPKERYKVTVEFIVEAEEEDEARDIIKDIIQQGVLSNEDDYTAFLEEYEISDIEVAEII